MAILGICMLNVLLFSAYIFSCFKDEQVAAIVFWIRNDIFILSLISLFYFIIADKIVKISLFVSFFIYLSYFISVIVDKLTNDLIDEKVWIIVCSFMFLTVLISGIYVTRRN